MMMRFLITAGTIGALSAQVALADDQWNPRLPEDVDLQPRQLFSIFTSGPSRRAPDRQIEEYGTGFAISERIIITAKHVTRKASEFTNKSGSDKITVPLRTVKVTYARDESPEANVDSTEKAFVTPSPVATIDASRIELLSLKAQPFELSVCDLDQQTNDTFYLLKFPRGEDEGNKNKKQPTAVTLQVDTDPTMRLGNLRRFEVVPAIPAGNDRAPEPGDSGSPILDSQGRVVGLLSAIQGESYLWVTPTIAFYDLIPPEEKHDVACNKDVTFSDLNKARDKLSETLAALQTQLGEATEMISEQQEQIGTLATKITDLQEQADALRAVDTDLIATDKRLDIEVKQADLLADNVMAIMLLEADKRGVPREVLIDAIKSATGTGDDSSTESSDLTEQDREAIFEDLRIAIQNQYESTPVGFAVNDMLAEMSEPTWSFQLTGGGAADPLLYIGYERQIARPLVSRRMKFCLRPIYELSPRLDERQKRRLKYLDVTERDFYEESEAITNTDEELMTVCNGNLRDPEVTKAAQYSFEVEISKHYDAIKYPELDMNSQPSRFYGYAVDGDAVRRNEEHHKRQLDLGNEESVDIYQEILHRMIFEIPEGEDTWAIQCYYFPQLEDNDPLDDMAVFIKITDEEEKEQYKCPTF